MGKIDKGGRKQRKGKVGRGQRIRKACFPDFGRFDIENFGDFA